MEIRTLQWDSDFFGLRIGRADIQSLDDAVELALQHYDLKYKYDLLYVFCKEGLSFDAIDAKLVDEKILYSKNCENKDAIKDVMLYMQSEPNESLYKLALVSGGYSRFKLDERLSDGSYELLYRKWIEKACPQEGTNKQIFAYAPDGIAKGMITVDYDGDKAQIGLVAVDTECQHQGIGTKIMSTLEYYLYRKGVMTIDVATQAANRDACRWYEKNGFVKKSVTPIYHWWL